MTIADIKKTVEAKMDQSIAAFKNNLTKIRTGRANPALLDTIQVDYYGSMVPARFTNHQCSALGKRHGCQN
jgi:ribosome recycling factor